MTAIRALVGTTCVLGCCVLGGALASAHAGNAIVLGDSLGVGLAEVSHLPNFAHISVHIRGPKALEQIRRAPAGVTAFVVLGTNDANGSIDRLDKSIDAILDAAQKKHMRLIWIGPPCVKQSWDTRSRKLDEMLAAKLPPRGVLYVPMRDQAFCTAGLHEPDGVHLKTKGYIYMWDKARRIAGLDGPAPLATASVGAATPAPPANQGLPAPAAPFALASTPGASNGWQEPKIYVLHVKRGAPTANRN
ncbi:MAG TPA: hypothetical protein VKX28_01145 [Xanthobacteraceae bacterium]|nr:hypothetical protein [Xanthobacteraceae bacterium]